MSRFLIYNISFSVYTDVECEHKGEQAFGMLEEEGRRNEEEGTHGKKVGSKRKHSGAEVSEQSLK